MKSSQQLIPVVTQDHLSGQVLMLAYMNRIALEKTLATGQAHYWSRSRQELWLKGETSGNTQRVVSIYHDCDSDALLLKVEQKGPACHTGETSCFYRQLEDTEPLQFAGPQSSVRDSFAELEGVIQDRKQNPREGSYVSSLFTQGRDRILKKVAEEAGEVIIASKNGDKAELVHELADLFFHLLVTMQSSDVRMADVWEELNRRREK